MDVEGLIALIILYVFSSPIGFLRWLIFRKKSFKKYLWEDAEYNITAFAIFAAIGITTIIIWRAN